MTTQPYLDSIQVDVRSAETTLPGDFAASAQLVARLGDRWRSFRPKTIASRAEVAATYQVPGQPDLTLSRILVAPSEWPVDLVASEVLLDGERVDSQLVESWRRGGGLTLPVVKHSVEVTWSVGRGLLDLVATWHGIARASVSHRRVLLPDKRLTSSVTVMICTNLFGYVES